MAHDKGSFDYKVIHPLITNILDVRSQVDNTVQVAMPFVKATTTLFLEDYLGKGNVGFTLGLHAIDEDTKYEDMYASSENSMPLIGYTYTPEGTVQRVYAKDPETSTTSRMFDRRTTLFNTGDNFARMPPPGITQATVSRNKNGQLVGAQLNISVPSLVQLESLHRTLLIPGMGMVLEWGQQFAVESVTTDITGELPDISYAMFPWHNKEKRTELLRRLALKNIGLEEILSTYVYPSAGQYMWIFGRIANFSTKSNSDGSFECTIKIVGPSEDAWAYSVKNTTIPAKDNTTKYFCGTDTNSVYSYFANTSPGYNLKSLLDDVDNGLRFKDWKYHVRRFQMGNKSGGEPTAGDKKPNVSQATFGEAEDAYFMTWRFFVNIVLNDPTFGIKGLFRSAMSDEDLKKISMLLPYANGVNRGSAGVADLAKIDDPEECYVGMHPYLRSVDLSTLIIVNEQAVQFAQGNPQYAMATKNGASAGTGNAYADARRARMGLESPAPQPDSSIFADSDIAKNFRGYYGGANSFLFETATGRKDRGFLSTGVWINHKAIVESMLGADTILRGITNLLDRMNTATTNYWQLTLDVVEPTEGLDHSYNYRVVDANLKESSDIAVEKFIDNVHVFNKYIRTDEKSGKLIGSDLIECNVDLSLPKRLFAQIATLGLVQPEDLKREGIEGEEKSNGCASPKISDPNDALRKMFAITSISNIDGKSPDLTMLSKSEIPKSTGICGKGNANTTAETGGKGYQSFDKKVGEDLKNADLTVLQHNISGSIKFLKDNKDTCNKCAAPTPTSAVATNTSVAKPVSVSYVGKSGNTIIAPINYTSTGETDTTKAIFAAGYTNGRIDRSKLTAITNIHYLYPDAATKWKEMIAAAKADGVDIVPSPIGSDSAYRSLDEQIATFKKRGWFGKEPPKDSTATVGSAAAPGNSNHGWGTAVDVSPGNDSIVNLPQYKWLKQNASKFNFKDTLGPTSKKPEPWHWEYIGGISPKKNNPTPTPSVSTPLVPPAPTPTVTATSSDICKQCRQQEEILKQSNIKLGEIQSSVATVEKLGRDFPALNAVFRYLEIFPEFMTAHITCDADGNFANAFGASPGTLSISADLVMPGINGIRVGELFWIDRIPSFYKAFGAFQVLTTEDVIDNSGWKTKIHARFNYLGTKWRQSMEDKFNNTNVTAAIKATNGVNFGGF